MAFNEINKVSEQELTPALQEKINSKANQTDFLVHTGDTNIHITKAERDTWNDILAKSNKYTDDKLSLILGAIDSSNTVKALLDTKLDISAFETFKNSLPAIAKSGKYSDLLEVPASLPYANNANNAATADKAGYATDAGNAKTADSAKVATDANTVGGIRITISGSSPANPTNDKEIWFDTSISCFKVFTGGSWKQTKGIWY